MEQFEQRRQRHVQRDRQRAGHVQLSVQVQDGRQLQLLHSRKSRSVLSPQKWK